MSDKLIIDGDVNKAKKVASGAGALLNPISDRKIRLPYIFLWADKTNGVICGSFRWRSKNWGICFPYADNLSRREMDKKHLRVRLRDTLDLLVHHGEKVIDKNGEIDQRKVNDMEAARGWDDPLWAARVEAFKKAVAYKEISKARAEELNLLL